MTKRHYKPENELLVRVAGTVHQDEAAHVEKVATELGMNNASAAMRAIIRFHMDATKERGRGEYGTIYDGKIAAKITAENGGPE